MLRNVKLNFNTVGHSGSATCSPDMTDLLTVLKKGVKRMKGFTVFLWHNFRRPGIFLVYNVKQPGLI